MLLVVSAGLILSLELQTYPPSYFLRFPPLIPTPPLWHTRSLRSLPRQPILHLPSPSAEWSQYNTSEVTILKVTLPPRLPQVFLARGSVGILLWGFIAPRLLQAKSTSKN